ncbi:hypothetical protein niasHT_038396 [Heterodera trifolii]|uniref:Uncharacterized protein n=1 Tax=Heterodera trifolii TaxID=157864 RepID=A0ABD2HVS7_9BILA
MGRENCCVMVDGTPSFKSVAVLRRTNDAQINAAPPPNVTTPSAGAKPSVRRPCSKRTPKAASSSRRSTTQRQVNLSECRVVVKMPQKSNQY